MKNKPTDKAYPKSERRTEKRTLEYNTELITERQKHRKTQTSLNLECLSQSGEFCQLFQPWVSGRDDVEWNFFLQI